MKRPSIETVPRERRHCVALGGTCRGQSLAVEGDGQVRCLTHAEDVVRIRRRRERDMRGGFGRRRVLDPDTTPPPRFRSPAAVLRFLEWNAKAALTNPDADLRGLAEARASAVAAVQALAVEESKRTTDLLSRLEHGGAAVALLERLRVGIATGPRRPLPGRRPQAVPETEPA